MQRNYPRMFSPADDQDKDGFKLKGNTKSRNPKTGIRNPEESSRFSNWIVQKLSENNVNANGVRVKGGMSLRNGA